MRKELLGIDPAFTGNAAKGADVNKDGKFNAIDFAKVRQYLLGIIKNF
jgi:endoglucanase